MKESRKNTYIPLFTFIQCVHYGHPSTQNTVEKMLHSMVDIFFSVQMKAIQACDLHCILQDVALKDCLLLRVDGDTVCNAAKAQTQASFVHLEILLFLSIFPSFCYTFLIFFNISISKGMTKRTHCH